MKKLLYFLLIFLGFQTLFALDPRAHEVLDYWFGSLDSPEIYPSDRLALWFGKNPRTDEEIRIKFEPLIIAAERHELDEWKETPRGLLALIILLDQFTRNVYRDTPQAFAFDPIAQQLSLHGISLCQDEALYPVERVFFYLPLEHAENLTLQELSVAKFDEIIEQSPPSVKPNVEQAAEYAYRHHEIIARFGRFPHRNKILGRPSTPEEEAFLEQPGSSF